MRAIRNHGGESTDRRWRRVAFWLAGIAMPAIVAVQAVAHESQRTTTAARAEPTQHVEQAVEAFVPVTESAEAMTECDVADSSSALAEVKAATEADPNDAAATSEGHQAETDVLILQVEASSYRNLDQTSLVFRADVVDLFTNHSGYQEDPVRLGWLRAPMSRDFESLRALIERYRALILNEEASIESEFIPHAPVLRIGALEISSRHPCFDDLERIFHDVWAVGWICVDCATYARKGDSIVRTRTRNGERRQMEVPALLLETLWECGPLGLDTSVLACADPEFGTFELGGDDPPASATEDVGTEGS